MKLSIKELREIKNNLPVNSELFHKINNQLASKIAKKKAKKAQRKIKLANETLKSLCEITLKSLCEIKEGNLSDLADSTRDIESVYDLADSIYAIKSVEVCRQPCSKRIYITVNSNELQEGGVERIVNFKINNPNHYLKFV